MPNKSLFRWRVEDFSPLTDSSSTGAQDLRNLNTDHPPLVDKLKNRLVETKKLILRIHSLRKLTFEENHARFPKNVMIWLAEPPAVLVPEDKPLPREKFFLRPFPTEPPPKRPLIG